MIKLAVILPAAGTGSRMRTETPKPYLRLKGATILEHTIRNFLRVDGLVQIVIATSNQWMSHNASSVVELKGVSISFSFSLQVELLLQMKRAVAVEVVVHYWCMDVVLYR